VTEVKGSVSRFLADEIRRARTTAEMTQTSFGRAASFSPSHVSAVESGTRALTMEFVRGADRALANGGLFERLARQMRLGAASPLWFHQWLTIEQEAVSLVAYEPALVPGLFQTPAYARAVLEADGTLTEEQIDQRVQARMDRQSVLTREHPPHVVAVLDESVLHRPVGGTTVMHEQLRGLARTAGHSPVQIQVIGNDVGMYPGIGSAFVLATMPDGSTVAYADTAVRGQVLDSAGEVATVRRKWETLRGYALPWRQSVALIQRVADEKWI
jgi:transcriptional regulator with XRE-family HTH domain